MTRKILTYTGGLIALYIVVAHASGFGRVVTAGANGSSKVARTLQGR